MPYFNATNSQKKPSYFFLFLITIYKQKIMTMLTVNEQQAQYLKEALQVVHIQSKLMRQCLVSFTG